MLAEAPRLASKIAPEEEGVKGRSWESGRRGQELPGVRVCVCLRATVCVCVLPSQRAACSSCACAGTPAVMATSASLTKQRAVRASAKESLRI